MYQYKHKKKKLSVSICLYSVLFCMVACQSRGAGDVSCPINTIRSGQSCLPYNEMGDGNTVVNTTQEDMSHSHHSSSHDAYINHTSSSDMGMNTSYDTHMVVDDYFVPSGFMGDGEIGGIVLITNDCPQRNENRVGTCHHFTHTLGEKGWGGVWWQNVDGNWGDASGYSVPTGLTRIQFTAWGNRGREIIHFLAGYGVADGFSVETVVELTDKPQVYTIDIAGIPYQDIAGGFAWYSTGESGDIDFYVDDIQYVYDDMDRIQPCTVSCAMLQAVDECMGIEAYLSCQQSCVEQLMNECSELQSDALSCIAQAGYTCINGMVTSVNMCTSELNALESCQLDLVGSQEKDVPFYIEDYFIMSGYMGGGTVEVTTCMDDISAEGTCLEITWLPEGSDWVGFFFQYPENNWGEQPGLMIKEGATQVEYTTWVKEGTQRANFAVGINEADGFSQETGYYEIGEEQEMYVINLPTDITEITGGFAWFLENTNRVERIVFYLDDVRWVHGESQK